MILNFESVSFLNYLNPQRIAGLSIIAFALSFSSVATAQQCQKSERKVQDECITKPQSNQFASGAMATQGAQTSIPGMGSGLSAKLQEAAAQNRLIAGACRAANTDCQTTCDQEIQTETAKGIYADQGKITKARQSKTKCEKTSSTEAPKYDAQAAKNDADAARSQATENASNQAESGGSEPGADLAPATDAGGAPSAEAGGGGGGQMLGALALGAGAAGLMGMMNAKPAVDPSGTGTIEGAYTPQQCAQKEDAFKKDSCTDLFLSNCKDNLTDARCEKFVGHYCGTSTEAPPAADSTNPSSLPNEGVGTPFCQLALSDKYCRSSGQPSCPSCANLTRMKGCTDSPASCLPQMTQADKEQAKVSCPTDPLFANPAFMAQAPTPNESGNVTVAPGMDDGGTIAASQRAVNGLVATYSNTGANSNGGQVSGSTGGSLRGSTTTASVGGGPSDSVGNGSAYGQRGPASHEQVAPGIAPAVGSSLFSRHSHIVNMRCAQGALNNCGPRSISSR